MALEKIDSIPEARVIANSKYDFFDSTINEPNSYFNNIKIVALAGGLEVDLDPYLTSIAIYRMYEKFVYPVVNIKLSLPYKIQKFFNIYYKTIKFRFSMWQLQIENLNNKNQVTSFPEEIYKDIILEPNDFDRTKFKNESEPSQNGFTDNNRVPLEIDLLRSDHIILSKTPIHGILHNVNYTDLLMYLLKDCPTNIVMNKPHRNDTEPQIILPTLNTPSTIKYIQEQFGIYKNGLRLFFDLDRAYCLSGDFDYDAPVGDESPVEYLNTVCYLGKIVGGPSVGCYKSDNHKINYVYSENSDIFKFSVSSPHYIYGEQMTARSTTHVDEHVREDIKYNEYGSNDSNKTNQTDILNNIKNNLNNTTLTPSNSSLQRQNNEIIHVVEENETVESIASKYNLTVAELMVSNNIENSNNLYVGQVLKLNIPENEEATLANISENLNRLENSKFNSVDSLFSEDNYNGENKESGIRKNYYYKTVANDFAENNFLASIKKQEVVYVLYVANIDYRFFTPNKKIRLSFIDEDCREFNGVYLPISMAITYSEVTPDLHASIGVIELVKINEGLDVSQ